MKELELYIHIPFCVRKCLYCDFLSFSAGEETITSYVEALITELTGKAEEARDYTVSSVFFGGGTPSLLGGERMRALMDCIRMNYRLSGDAEITMECNPGTTDGESLKEYRKAGINRLSIGLQSASDEELRALGRIHTGADFEKTFAQATSAGFDNISVDLMSALPHQTMESYEETLDFVLRLGPCLKHISAYSLIIEEGTPFYEMERKGQLQLPGEDLDRRLYERTRVKLEEAGFRRYEISNYARPGYECRHNVGYWVRKEYLGFGIGAASLFQGVRFTNDRSLAGYLDHPLNVRTGEQRLGKAEEAEEFLFLGLRLTDGISAGEFERQFGKTLEEVYGEVIRKHESEGLLEWYGDPTDQKLRFTLQGLDLANYCLADFLDPEGL